MEQLETKIETWKEYLSRPVSSDEGKILALVTAISYVVGTALSMNTLPHSVQESYELLSVSAENYSLAMIVGLPLVFTGMRTLCYYTDVILHSKK